MRRPILAANWKMNLGVIDEAVAFARSIRNGLNACDAVDRVICPPYVVLPALADVLRATSIALGAQNMHWEEKGAHTGEIAPGMLEGLCSHVILGHSERRASGGDCETNAAIQRKVAAALAHDLTPIVCVGETAEQRSSGETERVLREQLTSAFRDIPPDALGGCVVAYEPIWAIGSGEPATPADVNRIIGLVIRGALAELGGEAAARAVRVQYGGSVNPENIRGFMAMPEIDGALVGGASLKASYVDLVRAAQESGA